MHIARSLLIVVACGLASCRQGTDTARVTGKNGSVVVESANFEVTLPGVWNQESPVPKGAFFAGTKDKRQVILTEVLFASQLDKAAQMDVGSKIMNAARESEESGSRGKAVIIPEEMRVDEDDGGVWGGYVAIDGTTGRIVFCRILCDSWKAVHVYYAAWGFDGKPDAKAIATEFSGILKGVVFK